MQTTIISVRQLIPIFSYIGKTINGYVNVGCAWGIFPLRFNNGLLKLSIFKDYNMMI